MAQHTGLRDQARATLRGERMRGEGRIQTVLWLAVVVWAFFALFEYVPKRYRVAEFQDAIQDAAERAGSRGGSAVKTKNHLLWEAEQLGLPVTKDNLTVVVNSGFIRIEADYLLPIELPLYTWDWEVKHELRRKAFRF